VGLWIGIAQPESGMHSDEYLTYLPIPSCNKEHTDSIKLPGRQGPQRLLFQNLSWVWHDPHLIWMEPSLKLVSLESLTLLICYLEDLSFWTKGIGRAFGVLRIGWLAGYWWLMPVTLATQEAEMRRIAVWSQPWPNSLWDPISKHTQTRN
jgi:hypothetical protein